MTGRLRLQVRALLRDESGSTLVEFAFVAPILILILMGLFDLGFQTYAQTTLQGAMQDAGRSSTLEPGVITYSMMDADVRESVQNIIPGATVTFTRKNYQNFADIRQPEDFTDNNHNDECDNNEPFEDVNGNGSWDADRGGDGAGGARDAVLYNGKATFNRVFPLHRFLDLPATITIDAGTVLRNQPFDEQANRNPVVGHCT
ncbi:MAG: TadE family protein [Pontixanthobacter sp.]